MTDGTYSPPISSSSGQSFSVLPWTDSTPNMLLSSESKAPDPLGDLGKLPLEVRNHIYDNLVNKKYFLYWAPGVNWPASYKADTTILRLSRAISEEAIEVMYSTSTFLGKVKHHDSPSMGPADAGPMKRIQNLTLVFESCYSIWDEQAIWPKRQRRLTKAIVQPFWGDEKRKSCTVHIYIPKSELPSIVRNPKNKDFEQCLTTFCEALKGLVGFQTVMVQLLYQDEGCDKTYESSGIRERGLKHIQKGLKSSFGPLILPSKSDDQFDAAKMLAFRPYNWKATKEKIQRVKKQGIAKRS